MKKAIAVLLILCLALGCAATALAAKPTIVKQPETQTVKAGGTCTFTIKAKNTKSITWYFVNPETGEETTGKKLSKAVDGVKVSNPNSTKITLKRVPEEMHGWSVYCKVTANGYSEKSDTVLLLISGMPDPSESASSAAPAADTQVAAGSQITVTAEGALLQADGSDADPSAKLTLTAPASFTVMAEDEATSWVINGVTLTSDSGMSEFSLSGVSQNMTIIAKNSSDADETESTEEASEAEAEEYTPAEESEGDEDSGSYDEDIVPATPVPEVDKGTMCTITCENCTFTGGGFSRATEGQVPAGTVIRITAGRKGDLSKGYRINGGAYEHADEASFKITVKSELNIVMP